MASVKATEDFDVDLFETRLESLKDTQEGIQQMSTWCLAQRAHHKKIVSSWLNVFKRVRVEHRLVLFYLANDVIQYSKRKRYEFVESWATALQKATTMVRDDKVKSKILRIFSIWEQREIYNEEFLTDLCGLLNIAPPKKSHTPTIDSDDFQNANLISCIRECVELSEATDKSFKKLPKTPNCDIESIKHQLKDKTHSDDVEKELERYVTYIGAFTKNLQAEIKCRKSVVKNIDTAIKFYANQRGEVKVVVSAYKNFGSRIKLVKKKLDEIAPNLPSPIPSPDINAPSPEPDADLQLPDEQSPLTMNFLKNNFNGYSSYMDGNLPFDINDFKRDENAKSSSQPIEVIGSRSDDESYNPSADYYKPESISAYPGTNNMSIPGLTPMPVPSVPAGGYTSLARASHQYGDILPPPPNPPLFGGPSNSLTNNLHHNVGYSAHNPRTYNTDSNYNPNVYNRRPVGAASVQPLMPPPPMPPSVGSIESTENNDFNSTWDMNMSWTNPLDNSSVSNSSYSHTPIETPHSPPHFDSDAHNSDSTTLEYSDHDGPLSSAQDVDHRQLILPAFGIGTKLGLSKEKSRQLDIDHRNLISLTGSPGASDNDKKSWYQETNELSGDVDYRTFGQNIKTIETTTLPFLNDNSSVSSNDTSGNITSSVTSPQKNNSPSKESHKEDSYLENTDGGMAGYDPTDMVVDMDMSDDDLDDIFREVNEQIEENNAKLQNTNGEENNTTQQMDKPDSQPPVQRPPLLETPTEYEHQNNWDAAAMGQMSEQDWRQMTSMPWQNNNRMGGVGGTAGVPPPPPRPPFPMQFPYGAGVGNDNGSFRPPNGNLMGERGGFGGRGGGRGWMNSPQNQFRNFPRPPRGGGGGGGGSPYFNRGGGRGGGGPGGMRGSPGFRGKFRGKNNWI